MKGKKTGERLRKRQKKQEKLKKKFGVRILLCTFAHGMNNPLSILRLVVKAVRPSRTGEMKAVSDAFWLRRGYEALTFFGFIVTHSHEEADHFNSHYDQLKNHEMIHLRQAQATGDSWLRFYLRYGWYWLRGLWWNRRMKNAAYLLNPFELEAYGHDHDLGYAERCGENGAQEWRRFAKMTFDERKKIYETRTGT